MHLLADSDRKSGTVFLDYYGMTRYHFLDMSDNLVSLESSIVLVRVGGVPGAHRNQFNLVCKAGEYYFGLTF